MADVYKTTRGVSLDMNRLKLQNESTVAVGNAGLNARGDAVKGGKIIKTREQLVQEHYNISGNNIAKDAKIKHSEDDIVPDVLPNFEPTGLAQRISQAPVTDLNQSPLPNQPRGGLANAVSKSKEISDVLDAQRKRI
jgi:hypothetical protein